MANRLSRVTNWLFKRPDTTGAQVTAIPPWRRSGSAQQGPLRMTGNPVQYQIEGASSPPAWFGPQQPIAPFAPEDQKGRAWSYPIGWNINIASRQTEAIGFPQLRALADGYDILRAVIETRKDQLAKLQWELKYLDEDDDRDIEKDPRYDMLHEVFDAPDKEHDYDSWLRAILEDMFVIDAVALYKRLNRGGKPYAIEQLDGATINRLLNRDGRTPVPPSPAYQQIINGMPAWDFTTDELIYYPRNVRIHKAYGFSPVEQIVLMVNMGLRREISQLQYFTDGSVPDKIVSMPEDWSSQMLSDFEDSWQKTLAGNTADRRHVKFVPGGTGFHVFDVKEPPLKTDFDEFICRVVCFAFSIPPTAFIRQMNRATAEQQQDTALEEGLVPLQSWVVNLHNKIIREWYGITDIGYAYADLKEIDPVKQATINVDYIKNAIKTPNEVRALNGDDPAEGGDDLVFVLPTGPMLLSQVADQAQASLDQAQARAETAKNPPQPQIVAAPGTAAKPEANGAKPASNGAKSPRVGSDMGAKQALAKKKLRTSTQSSVSERFY